MNLIRQEKDRRFYHLMHRETMLLMELLKVYPLLSADFQTLSKSAEPAALAADQAMLQEALAAQKEENKRVMRAIFKEHQGLKTSAEGDELTLDSAQIEALLQTLNDIRVGAWKHLGCPSSTQERKLAASEKNLRWLSMMEWCAYFQTHLLESLG